MKKKISDKAAEKLLETLKLRFEKNRHRHKGIKWDEVESRLKKYPDKLWSVHEMEITGGEPDVISYDAGDASFIFCDCSDESPKGRRSLCYDPEALASRKEHKPLHSAIGLAMEIGIELLDEAQYAHLQTLGCFDKKTSSWLKTPESIRALGGALFGDFRFGRVFTYHNGAESYYAARGFRGMLRV